MRLARRLDPPDLEGRHSRELSTGARSDANGWHGDFHKESYVVKNPIPARASLSPSRRSLLLLQCNHVAVYP